jgi:hypothetical protein
VINIVRFITIIISLSVALVSYAAGTAEELLMACEGSTYDKSYCEGYIFGYYDGRTTNDHGIIELKTCMPSDESLLNSPITYTQMVRVFVQWAKDNPSKLHLRDWQAVRSAFAQTWPCKNEESFSANAERQQREDPNE